MSEARFRQGQCIAVRVQFALVRYSSGLFLSRCCSCGTSQTNSAQVACSASLCLLHQLDNVKGRLGRFAQSLAPGCLPVFG